MENIPSPTSEPQSLAELHAQNARELCAMFMGLAKLGAEMVALVAERARDEAYAPAGAPTQLPELVAAHDVMMRSLRRTGLMIQKLTKPAPAPREPGRSGDSGRARSGRRDEESLEDLERLSDAELEALESIEAEEELANRPLGETIGEILKTVGVVPQASVDRFLHLTPVEIAAHFRSRAEHAASGGRADDGAGVDAMRGNGATGCRDP
jgi:hypothetical protein